MTTHPDYCRVITGSHLTPWDPAPTELLRFDGFSDPDGSDHKAYRAGLIRRVEKLSDDAIGLTVLILR